MHAVIPYLIAAGLAGAGVYGVCVRRNAVLLLMSVELILAAVTLIFVTGDAVRAATVPNGQVASLFVIVLAAAEIGIGLAILLRLYRGTASIDATRVDTRADDAAAEPDRGTST